MVFLSKANRQSFYGLRGDSLNRLLILVVGIDLLLYGYDQGVMGGLLTLPSFTSTFPSICTTHDCLRNLTAAESSHRSTLQGITVSCYNIGAFCGAVLILRLGDLLGRRKSVFLGCALVSIGAILQTSAFSIPHFIVGRIICGLGTGVNTSTVPVWQAECIKPHLRGPVMALETSLIVAGVMVSYWIDFGFSYIDNSMAWRFPIAFQLIFSLSILFVIMGLPESPRWLMLRNKHDDAREVLCALYDLPADDTMIVDETYAINASLHACKDVGFRAAFKNGPLKNGTRTLVAVSIQILSQITGINIITYYAASIYENEIGMSPFISRVVAACNGTQYFIACMFSPYLVKRFNRRSLLMFASAGLAGSMAVLAGMNSQSGQATGIVAAVCLFVFNTFFGIAWVPISWIYPAEVVPLATRTPVNALATSSNWIFNFMVVMVTPIAFNNIKWKTYIIFAVFNAIAVPIIYTFYPETRGRSLEEIDLIFSESANIFGAVKLSKTLKRHYDDKGNMTQSLAQDVENSAVVQNSTMKNDVERVEHVEQSRGQSQKVAVF